MAHYDNDAWDLLQEGLTYAAVAEKLGITEKQVNHAQQRVKKGQEEVIPKVVKSNDAFIITTGLRVLSISEAKLKLLKEYYCGQGLTINQVCRKLNIPRRNFMVIKSAFGITKDDVPFLPDEMLEFEVDDLVEETLEKRKDQYFVKLEQKEITAMKAELAKYRQQDYFVQQIHEAVTEHMDEFAKTYAPPKIEVKECSDGEYMLEIDLVDAHIGKLAWYGEVGASYDYKIARKRFQEVIQDICYRCADRPIAKILFIVGSDLFTFDTIFTTTTMGTPQDSDLRWQKLFAVVVDMLVEAIDMCSVIAPVEALLVPGNHDKMTSFYAIKYLSAWYKNSDRVTVSEDIKTRKYIEWGKCLIGFSHGDKEGKRLSQVMPIEQPAAWGRTKYRELHVGHFHSEKTVEQNGVIVRNLSSITGTDSWHFERGYVGAVPKCQSFLWDKTKGLREIWHTNID